MMNINVRIRHYWFEMNFEPTGYTKYSPTAFYTLDQNQVYTPTTLFTQNVDQNYNAFNIDAVYTWQFAPGSFVNIVWKNFAENFDRTVSRSYFKNFDNTMESDDNNNISLKVIYFLDYLELRKWMKKKKK
jgi:hypothetical protein